MFFSCINICRVSKKLFEHAAVRDPESVNAMKQTRVIVISYLSHLCPQLENH